MIYYSRVYVIVFKLSSRHGAVMDRKQQNTSKLKHHLIWAGDNTRKPTKTELNIFFTVACGLNGINNSFIFFNNWCQRHDDLTVFLAEFDCRFLTPVKLHYCSRRWKIIKTWSFPALIASTSFSEIFAQMSLPAIAICYGAHFVSLRMVLHSFCEPSFDRRVISGKFDVRFNEDLIVSFRS